MYPGIFTPHVHPSLEFHGGINWGYLPWSIIGIHFLDGTAEALRSCVHSARVHTTEQYHNNVFRRSRESSVLLKTVLHRPSRRVPRGEHRRNRAEGLPLRYCQDACPGKDSWETRHGRRRGPIPRRTDRSSPRSSPSSSTRPTIHPSVRIPRTHEETR